MLLYVARNSVTNSKYSVFLGGVSLDGVVKVGDNTNPNLYPLIMGKHIIDDWKDLLLKPLDDLNFIFKDYEKQG